MATSPGREATSQSSSAHAARRKRLLRRGLCALAVSSASMAVALFGWSVASKYTPRKPCVSTPEAPADSDGEVRIPLKDVLRFKERQWFKEEVQGAKDGDPNSMVRLAKMYLHGQGCKPSVLLAREWLNRARQVGVGCSLPELFATDDEESKIPRLQQMIAEEKARTQLRKDLMQHV